MAQEPISTPTRMMVEKGVSPNGQKNGLPVLLYWKTGGAHWLGTVQLVTNGLEKTS